MSVYNAPPTAAAAGLGYAPGTPGGTQYLTATIPALGATWSIELWFQSTHTGTRQKPLAIGSAGQVLVVELDTGGRLLAYALPRVLLIDALSVPICDGQPHHIAITCGAGATTLYRDGAVISTVAATATMTGTTLYLATGSTLGTAGFNGTLDEVALYTTALSAADVGSHYAAGHFGAGPLTWTWQNEIESAQLGTLDLQANHVRVFAKGVQAEVWDEPAAAAIGAERYRHVVDRVITSNAQAAIRAANEVWLERRKRLGGELHVPLNPGLELLDIIEVIDTATATTQGYRCQAISAAFDVLHATYDMTLGLTGT